MGKFDLGADIFTDYDGTITEATFQYNEMGGQMKFTIDEIDGRQEPTFEFYKLPSGWESNDGGETIERIDGDPKKRKISKGSQWGKFLAHINDIDEDVLTAEAQFNASEWIGTRWHFEVTPMGVGKPYKFEKDGEKMEGVSKDKNYPTEFLGKDSQSSSTTPTNGNGKVDNLSVLTSLNNPVVEAQIQDLAKTLPFKEWFKEGYTLLSSNGVTPATHPDLITAMGGTELYASLGGKG